MRIGMTRTLIGLLILAGAVFVLHTVAMDYYLYWYFWWYDIMMHLLGGALIGGVAVWGALRFRPTLSRHRILATIFVSIVLVGIGWELFEYASGVSIGESNIVADTILDLIMDTLGAFAVGLLVVHMTAPRSVADASSQQSA